MSAHPRIGATSAPAVVLQQTLVAEGFSAADALCLAVFASTARWTGQPGAYRDFGLDPQLSRLWPCPHLTDEGRHSLTKALQEAARGRQMAPALRLAAVAPNADARFLREWAVACFVERVPLEGSKEAGKRYAVGGSGSGFLAKWDYDTTNLLASAFWSLHGDAATRQYLESLLNKLSWRTADAPLLRMRMPSAWTETRYGILWVLWFGVALMDTAPPAHAPQALQELAPRITCTLVERLAPEIWHLYDMHRLLVALIVSLAALTDRLGVPASVGRLLGGLLSSEHVPPVWRLRVALASSRLARTHSEAVVELLYHPAALRDVGIPAIDVAKELENIADQRLAHSPELALLERIHALAGKVPSQPPHSATLALGVHST